MLSPACKIRILLVLQAEEVLITLTALIKIVVEETKGVISTSMQEAARHLHDQGILVSLLMF